MQAILDAPDTGTVAGLRDRAMLHLCYAAGLRVSELTGLTLDSLSGPQLETVRILGKGRRDRDLRCGRKRKPSSMSGLTSGRRSKTATCSSTHGDGR